MSVHAVDLGTVVVVCDRYHPGHLDRWFCLIGIHAWADLLDPVRHRTAVVCYACTKVNTITDHSNGTSRTWWP